MGWFYFKFSNASSDGHLQLFHLSHQLFQALFGVLHRVATSRTLIQTHKTEATLLLKLSTSAN